MQTTWAKGATVYFSSALMASSQATYATDHTIIYINRARRERARAPGQVNEPGLQYELHHNPYLPNLNSQK